MGVDGRRAYPAPRAGEGERGRGEESARAHRTLAGEPGAWEEPEGAGAGPVDEAGAEDAAGAGGAAGAAGAATRGWRGTPRGPRWPLKRTPSMGEDSAKGSLPPSPISSLLSRKLKAP